MLLGVVLLAHGWLLGLWTERAAAGAESSARPAPPAPARPLSVRQLAASPAPAAVAAAATRPDATATPSAAPAAPPLRERPRVRAPAPAASALPPAAPEAVAGPAEAPVGVPPPVYATRLPPPARLRYSLQRGSHSGSAELDWSWSAGRYRLSLQGLGPAAAPAAWVSQGTLDEAGIAPERYTENRRGRELRAANFQREAGRISFSGPSTEYPLVAGAQDRLSWLIQLAAVLAANPELAETRAQIQVFVVGTRGDAQTWVFTVQGREDLDLPGGPIAQAVHLLREPQQPYDTQAHVWLDPAQHHLPVRLHLRVRATGEGTLLEWLPPR